MICARYVIAREFTALGSASGGLLAGQGHRNSMQQRKRQTAHPAKGQRDIKYTPGLSRSSASSSLQDFIVHRLQIYEARASGADTLLLIVAILSVDELKEFISTSRELGMEPLVEAANEAEMHTAVAAGARVVGVNNRDLRSFKVDLGTTARLIAHVRSAKDLEIQQPVFVLSLSGIRGGTDVGTVARGCVPLERHADSSVHLAGILVGEALMKASDPAQLVAEMRGAFRRDSHTAGGAAADAVCRGLVKVCGITNAEDALQAARSGAQLLGMIRVPGSKRCCSPTTARGISEQVKLFREQDPTPALQAGLQTALAQAAGSSAATRAELATGGDLSAACAWFNTFWRVGLQAAAQRAPPLTVGVYQNAPMEHVAADAAACGFDLVQLHGDESVQDVLQLPPTLPVIRVVHLPPADSAQPQGKACGELLQHAVPGAAAVLLVDARRAGQQGGGTGAAVDWAALGHLQASVAELAPGAAHLPFIVAGGVTPDNAARAIHESKASGVDVSSGVEGAPTDAGVPKKHHPAVLQYVTASRAALQGAAETQCADQGTAAGAAASSSAAAASAAPTS